MKARMFRNLNVGTVFETALDAIIVLLLLVTMFSATSCSARIVAAVIKPIRAE